uniref:Uncharacterized protein At1g51745 n=1 Tax=Anthurium amnicola TaxID=1678845 RepID=A0A1D1ZC89_9ARAE
MGSCCESDSRMTKRIDGTAGGLVWVRRRNGSWWPGRILGLDELPESCSVSPRAGTPVKLLGREDGSMDWYNLEKSTRIKAFRCGEYDECIEKARVSAVQASRIEAKERKYARREDAILHALELEQVHYMQSKQELGSLVNIRNGTVSCVGLGKEQGHLARKVNKLEGKLKTKLSQSKIPMEQKVNLNTVEVHVMQEERWKTSTDSEDDGTEGAKRMRGLQELGLGVVSQKTLNMIHGERPCEPSHQDDISLGESNIDNGFSSMSTLNSSKEASLSLKKKTQVAQAHEPLKRKNRRRQLTKVLKSSATVEVPSICHESGNSNHLPLHGVTWERVGVSEPTESKKADYSDLANGNLGSSETSCVEASLDVYEDRCGPIFDVTDFCSLEFVDDGFLDIPVVWKEIQTGDFCSGFASSASGKLQSDALGRQGNRCCEADLIKQDDNVDVVCASRFLAHANNTRLRIENCASEKDAKGEKNSKYGHRSAGSRKLFGRFDKSQSYLMGKPDFDAADRVDNSSFDESLTSDKMGQRAKCGVVSDNMQDQSTTGPPTVNCLTDINCEGQVYGSAEKTVQSDEMGVILHSPPPFERQIEPFLTRDLPLSQLQTRRSLPRRQIHPTACSCCQDLSIRSFTVGSVLYDVKLEVQASYQGPRVPLISLLSKLNGKAIVGHPITVEILEDGYCNTLVGHFPAASCNIGMHHGQKENQSKHKGDTVDGSLLEDGCAMVVKLQKRTGCIAKLHLATRREPSNKLIDRSFLSGKKSYKIRKSGLLARKIRKLSSITVDCEHKEEKRKSVSESLGKSVACVPLKLVFGRINEALSCPSQPC